MGHAGDQTLRVGHAGDHTLRVGHARDQTQGGACGRSDSGWGMREIRLSGWGMREIHAVSMILLAVNPAATLMRLLFEVTEVDFELSVEQSSFLDETWVIPVMKTVHIPPLKSLDTVVK